MCRDLPSGYSVSEANQTKLVNNALGFFVQEKFAFWKTAGVFGPAEDNALIAHSYVRNYFAGVLGPDLETGGRVFDNFETTRRSPNGFFGDLAQDLISRVEFLFKYLDDALLRPGESRPR